MNAVRAALLTAVVVAAVVLQATVFPHFSVAGVVPDLALLVVVAAALTRGPQTAMLTGFVAGLLLDLAPPADHVAGRWALALVLVGYVAGLVRRDARPTTTAVLGTVAASSFVGTSVFALSGIVLGDGATGVGDLLRVVGMALVWDVLLTPLLLPALLGLFRQLEPDRVPA